MPLLKKKQFEKQGLPDFLRDDEEVFYCETTNEIFRDYDEFSERMLLCNSMVWTCSMTGKSNLTYMEATESEENAKKSLKEFSMELRVPILYLASNTKRSAFGDMAEDVFSFVKDRYFIGENLEACFTANKWKEAHVLQVIPPANADSKTGSLPANLYKYEIEHLDADDNDITEIMIVDCNQIRRKKHLFSREKCKLFLKQYVEQDESGTFTIKPAVLIEFGINKIRFEQIFDGPHPVFDTSKKILNGKKTKQETLTKYLTKNANTNGLSNSLIEQMKNREEEFRQKKAIREEEKLAAKQKRKEDNIKATLHLKEWFKPKEDLELEDHRKLPDLSPIKTKVPDQYVGDLLMILDFVETFAKILSTKDFFASGLTLDLLARALLEQEVAGPFTDMIQMLLAALFNVQDEESNAYRTAVDNVKLNQGDFGDITFAKATKLATMASKWSRQHQGIPLLKLPLYTLTVSEVLRLHLLSSGALINDVGTKWRYAQRGGYTSQDDPGLHFRIYETRILKLLAYQNVVQLAIGDKIKILLCLINQLLTYADVRDIIEERISTNRRVRVDLKVARQAERKQEQEFVSAKMQLKKVHKDNLGELNEALLKLQEDYDFKLSQTKNAIEKLVMASGEYQTLLGSDRAFRQYLKLDSLPAVLVNNVEENPGVCLDEIVKQVPELVNANRQDIKNYVLKTYEEMNLSDKENAAPKKVNGLRTSLSKETSSLLLCSADQANCVVHGVKPEISWNFISDEFSFNELVNNLNKRGIREGELQQVLTDDRERLLGLIGRTPVHQLNNELENEEQKAARKPVKNRYEGANLGYPSDMTAEDILHNALIDNLLEMEEKMDGGNLGKLCVADRIKWRDCLEKKSYDDIDQTIVKKEKKLKVKSETNRSRSATPEIPDNHVEETVYNDPGQYLRALNDSEDEEVEEEQQLRNINALAVALLQIAYSVESKYLKKPLGRADMGKNDKKAIYDVLEQWEQSLLASTSFSQVFLHYGTLDSCIMWSRSVLLARCRICRRQKDSDKMLLCDSCNLGHHLYCLKPILRSVPEGEWFCDKCRKDKEAQEKLLSPEPKKKRRQIFRVEEESDEGIEGSDEDGDESVEPSENDFAEESATNGDVVELCKTCGSGGELINCEKCSTNYHIECVAPPLRRAPRGSWTCSTCKGVKRDDSDEEVIHSTRRSNRREDNRLDLPLHNAPLQELLSDVMKHTDAWAFLRPVLKNDVPDYYDVITKPMDFGTIKYKLNMGEYKEDSALMKDVVLVFENCNTYNHKDAEVYKCGVRLLKHFQKKCKELGLVVPEELMDDDDFAPRKKRRTK